MAIAPAAQAIKGRMPMRSAQRPAKTEPTSVATMPTPMTVPARDAA